MLLDSKEILKIESLLISLFDRTFQRGLTGNPAKLKATLAKQFKSATFRIQLDKLIDDLYLTSVKYTDAHLDGSISASTDYYNNAVKLSASSQVMPLTEEAVRQSVELSDNVAESIIRTLKDEGIYQENPRVLAKRMKDLWGGEKYRAERFARTFSADVATSTTLHRYKQQGIEECQFYATIDSKTSPQCRIMHGTVFKTDSADLRAHSPPTHFHCRSSLIPITSFSEIDDSLRYENRNFEKPVSQNFKPLKEPLDKDLVKGTFKNIDVFNDKYRIDKFILDEDIEKRLAKLGVDIDTQFINNIPRANELMVNIEDTYKTEADEIETLINKRLELRDKKYDFAKDVESRRALIIKEYEEGKISDALLNKKLDLIDLEWNKIDALNDEIEKLVKLQDAIHDETRGKIKKLLYINDGDAMPVFIKLDPRYTENLNFVNKRTAEFEDTTDFFNKVLNKDLRNSLPEIQINELSSGRAFTRQGSNMVWLGNDSSTDTLIHELGHNLEFNNPYIKDSANKILAKRTAGEEAVKLKDITGNLAYKDTEITKHDKFFSPYVGKIYIDGYTEVTSMALQYLYKDPEYLYKNDPELFEWIVNVVRGYYD